MEGLVSTLVCIDTCKSNINNLADIIHGIDRKDVYLTGQSPRSPYDNSMRSAYMGEISQHGHSSEDYLLSPEDNSMRSAYVGEISPHGPDTEVGQTHIGPKRSIEGSGGRFNLSSKNSGTRFQFNLMTQQSLTERLKLGSSWLVMGSISESSRLQSRRKTTVIPGERASRPRICVKIENWRIKLGYYGKLVVNSIGRSGGLCILWDSNIDVVLLTYSQEHIHVSIKEIGRQTWRFTGFTVIQTEVNGSILGTLCAVWLGALQQKLEIALSLVHNPPYRIPGIRSQTSCP
ncbi:hypothetical protein Dsin_016342 [Dipteronia sinensis]|uniref:Uncharacterized protein n=1 Tax=Dipteronia sinensis TaxID=43782 RepID=A0AAE0ADK0_9ROSI|nr:hypothetical protein Dsin_016342 [Dipteronia sinensis]